MQLYEELPPATMEVPSQNLKWEIRSLYVAYGLIPPSTIFYTSKDAVAEINNREYNKLSDQLGMTPASLQDIPAWESWIHQIHMRRRVACFAQ